MCIRDSSRVTDSPVIVRVGPIESDNTKPLALIMSTELVWPEGFETVSYTHLDVYKRQDIEDLQRRSFNRGGGKQ